MEDRNSLSVEEAKEPSIAARFGFQVSKNPTSAKIVKISAAVVCLCGVTLFLMSSPEKPEGASSIKTPEGSQLVNHSEIDLQEYSQTVENQKLRSQNIKRTSQIVVRLPGLQKIDRRLNGKIPPGSIVRAVLVTGASNGAVRAEAKETLRVQGETLIPQGAVLLGTGQSTEDRLFIRFSQLVLKDGTAFGIQGQAADSEDKTVGLKGSKVGRYAVKYAAAVGLNFASGLSAGLQEKDVIGGQVVTRSDMKNALLNGASKAALEMGNESMTDLRNNPPIIQVEAGKEILILFEGGH